MASAEHFTYSQYARATDFVRQRVREHGMEPDLIRDGVITGSGLGKFVPRHLDRDSVRIPFNEIWERLGVSPHRGRVKGHAKALVIGPLKEDASSNSRLLIAQAGREHPYEGISTPRATFWIRVMQLLGVEVLLGSNAAGVVTPDTLKVPGMMLIAGDRDVSGDEGPLVGPNVERLGPRCPDMSRIYPAFTRSVFEEVAQRMGLRLKDGLYFRKMGPKYETADEIYELRKIFKGICEEARVQPGERRYAGERCAVVGMSTTYEAEVVEHACQSKKHPAFRLGRGWVSVCTNNAASLGIEPMRDDETRRPLDHSAVEEAGNALREEFGHLFAQTLMEFRSPRMKTLLEDPLAQLWL